MVPKIRFEEFTANWKDQVLEDVCSVIMDGTHFSPKSKDGPKKYITSKNIRNEGMLLDDVAYISEEEHRAIYKKCPVQYGDVLLTKDGANTGNCCLNSLKEEFSLLSSVAVIRGKENSLKSSYLLQVLQSKRGQSKINDHIAGQAITRITLKKINEFSFSIPELDEQSKIVSFLSSIDEKITLFNKQYELLCHYKKGMMQKIFSQELRFKDENGEEYPEWNYDEISSLFSNKSKKYNPLSGVNYPCIELDCISQGDGQLLTTLNSSQQQSIKNIFQEGDVLFGKLRPYLRKYILANFDGVCSSEIWVLKGILMSNSYLYQFVQTDFFINLANKSTGSKMPRADWDTISSTFVYYPCLEEQSKIANVLSALDDKIAAKKAELDKLKTWKQGLLQQMFV